MKRRKHHRRFWHKWHEQGPGDSEHEKDFNHRGAWHRHFAGFLGMPPENHWLFGGRRFKPWVTGGWGPPGLFNPFIADLMSKGGGLLALYVLFLLAEKPRYGNDIMREIETRTNRHWRPNPGAVYPLLNLMEEGGLISGEWEDSDKRTRKIYQLTRTGENEFARLKEVMRPKLKEAINILQGLYTDLESNEGP